ncbi:MAG: helix-turn-helix domain-containing protein [Bdellovibrionota bacterium]
MIESYVPKSSWAPGQTLRDIERLVIEDALQYFNQNRTHTAMSLGISLRKLRQRIALWREPVSPPEVRTQ